MKFIHSAYNTQLSETNLKTFKVDKLLQKSIVIFKRNNAAGKNLVIDESVIPFRGRLRFRQYPHGKAHKYSIKVFKLADTNGYIYLKLYAGKSDNHRAFSCNKYLSIPNGCLFWREPNTHGRQLLYFYQIGQCSLK